MSEDDNMDRDWDSQSDDEPTPVGPGLPGWITVSIGIVFLFFLLFLTAGVMIMIEQ